MKLIIPANRKKRDVFQQNLNKTLKAVCTPLLLLVVFFGNAHSTICHPEINSNLPQYMVGYGSLIDEHSKQSTSLKTGENIPVLIKGFIRRWSAHGNLPGYNTTFLSVNERKDGIFNGVIYQIASDPNEIARYDDREMVYCRKELKANQIKVYAKNFPEKKQVWIYYPKLDHNQRPTRQYPITQSYIDIFVRGCIKIEEKYKIKGFAQQCILTTQGWPKKHWVNDRIYPRRPFTTEPYARKIDGLLDLLHNSTN